MAELIDTVLSLKQQGYSNNQIIQYLQSQGRQSYEIFDALSQAESQSRPLSPSMPASDFPRMSSMNSPTESQFSSMSSQNQNVEEVVESVVEEKWKVFEDGVKKILEWKNETDARLVKIETELSGLKETFSQMQGAFFGKLGEYEKGIVDVSTEIKAMDRVFQKIVPTLTESVAELSRISKAAKDKKAKE